MNSRNVKYLIKYNIISAEKASLRSSFEFLDATENVFISLISVTFEYQLSKKSTRDDSICQPLNPEYAYVLAI